MSDQNKKSLRQPETISNLDELKAAKKKASINATQDKLRLTKNIQEIKEEGPRVLLQNVVIPVAVVGIAAYGIGKLLSSNKSDDHNRTYYREPSEEDYYSSESRVRPEYAYRPRKESAINSKKIIAALPVILKFTKMGINYLEANGKTVPPVLSKLFVTQNNQ